MIYLIIIIQIIVFIIIVWPIISDFLIHFMVFYIIRTPNSRIPKVLKWIRDTFYIVLRNMKLIASIIIRNLKLIASIFFSILGIVIFILLILNINGMYNILSSEIPLLLDYMLSKSHLNLTGPLPGHKLITILTDLYMNDNSNVDSPTDTNANSPDSNGGSPSDNRRYVYPSPDRNNPPYVYPQPDINSEERQSSPESVQGNNNSESVRARTSTNNTNVNSGSSTDNASIDPTLLGNTTDTNLISRFNPIGTPDVSYNPNLPSEINTANHLNVGRNAPVYLGRSLLWPNNCPWPNNSPYRMLDAYFRPDMCNGYDWSNPSWANEYFKSPREETILRGYNPNTSMSQQPYARDLSRILYDASFYRGDILNRLSFRDQVYAESMSRSFVNANGRLVSYRSQEFINYLWNLP